MRIVVTDPSGSREVAGLAEARAELHGQEFTWIDIEDPPEQSESDGQFVESLGLDAARFGWIGQLTASPRYRLTRDGGEFVVPIVHRDGVAQVYVVVTPLFLLTVHRRARRVIDPLRAELEARGVDRGATALFLFSETALLSFRMTLLAIRDEIDDLEEAVFARPTRARVVEIAALRHHLIELRRALIPYAEAVATFETELPTRDDVLPLWQRLSSAHARQVTSVEKSIEAVQQSISHTMDTYNSLIATRQSQVVNRLTVVALVFLPLTYLTGFFGMNFEFLQEHIRSSALFWTLGVGLQVLSLIFVLLIIRRAGWMRLLRGDAAGINDDAAPAAGAEVRAAPR